MYLFKSVIHAKIHVFAIQTFSVNTSHLFS